MRFARQLSHQLVRGMVLTRRERLLLECATVDMLRLMPFVSFLWLPFADVLLPIVYRMFPDLMVIPRLNAEATDGEIHAAVHTAMNSLCAMVDIHEYLLSHASSDPGQAEALRRVVSGEVVHSTRLRTLAPLFESGGPMALHVLPYSILMSLARVSGAYSYWYNIVPRSFSRRHALIALTRRFQQLRQEDATCQPVSELSVEQLVRMCLQRNLAWSADAFALRSQLHAWMKLSANAMVPYHLLFVAKPRGEGLRCAVRTLPVDARRHVLGIDRILPRQAQDTIYHICEKVEPHDRRELRATDDTEAIVRRIRVMQGDAEAIESDLNPKEVREAVAEYLEPKNVDDLHAEIQSRHGKVTVATTVEYLAQDIHFSSHIVSNLFDALEMGDGGRIMTRSMLSSLAARCRARAAEEATEECDDADEQFDTQHR